MSDTNTEQHGGGIKNVIEGIIHTPAHIEAAISSAFHKAEDIDPDLKAAVLAALPYVKNSIATIAADFKAKGEPVVKQAQTDIVTQLTAAAAGSAVIKDVKAAGSTLADDTLHIIMTDLLTDVAGLVAKVA